MIFPLEKRSQRAAGKWGLTETEEAENKISGLAF